MSQAEINTLELLRKLAEQAEEIKQLKSKKKFGLVWEDKPDAQVLRVKDEAPMLHEDTARTVVTDQNATNHILINGDNFHALTALRATHTGKVDVIYIDPPYNTGIKDFIYNDNYLDKEDGYRHSKWLSFMEKRLSIAKELLADSGVIFVSIDDNEQARLKLLLDDVFGPENFIGTIIHQRAKGGGQAKHIVKGHDYIHVFAKKEALIASLGRPKVVQGKTELIDGIEYLVNDDIVRKVFGKKDPSEEDRRCAYEELEKYKGPTFKNEIDKKLASGEYFLKRVSAERQLICSRKPVSELRSKLYSIIKALSEEGKKDLEKLGLSQFSYPKSVELLRQIVGVSNKRDALILDFFAGSGTTAHAVAELNKEDGGKRQCILVTDGGKTETTGESAKNTEEGAVNIAEEITYERMRRVLTGKDWADEKEHEPLGGNLRYFEVEMEPTPHGITTRDQRLALEKYTIEHAKIATNIFNEVASVNELDDETLLPIEYKVFSDEPNARYLVGVNAHDFTLAELEEWITNLSDDATVIMVGNGLEEIEWVNKNSDRITVDDVLGRVIRSRKYIASKL